MLDLELPGTCCFIVEKFDSGFKPCVLDEAGALLAETWRLPVALRDAIAQQFDETADAAPLARLVRGAARMANCVRNERDWCEPDPGLTRLGLDMPTQLAGIRYMNAIRSKTLELAETVFLGH